MGTTVRKGRQKQVALSTVGDLLVLRTDKGLIGFTNPKVLEISSLETSAADYVQIETGPGLTDGGSAGNDARQIPCSALPVEIDVHGQSGAIKLYGSKAMAVTVVVR